METMNKLAAFVCLMCGSAAFAEPKPPTAEILGEWVSFSRPVRLMAKKESTAEGDTARLGEAVWIYSYSADKETVHSYIIGLYKAGTLFGEKRAEAERSIPELAVKMKGFAKQEAEQLKQAGRRTDEVAKEIADWMKLVGVETRHDGRKVYFAPGMAGPGGGMILGFATVGGYDVLLEQVHISQDGVPENELLKDPPKPTKALPEVFMKLERHILNSK